MTPPRFVKIDSSDEPHLLFEFMNVEVQRSLWVSTRRGCKIWDPGNTKWQPSNLIEVLRILTSARPCRFRPGEAAWVAGGGGDVIQYQANGVVVPASGPGGAKQGMPAGKEGLSFRWQAT